MRDHERNALVWLAKKARRRPVAAMAAISATILLLSALGCAKSPTGPVHAGTEPEALVLAETARFSGALGLRVRGEITEHLYSIKAGVGGCPKDGPDCYATGWYQGGVAWYYRRGIADAWEIGGAPLIRDIAAHETCHAQVPSHNAAHVACILSVGAVPTYDPATITGEGLDAF